MAPEIHLRMPYSGEAVDLFATAIVLFIMYAGTPPFTKADPKDPYFKLICNNKNDTFWAAHTRYKPSKDFFNAEFKDLLNKMIAFDPKKRLSIAEIKEHAWYKGSTLSMDNIRKEFDARRSKVTAEVEKERKMKEIEKEKKK
jgi:serine/threonine protein kinase